MSISNYSEKKFWINEYGLLLFRNKYKKELILKRPYHVCENNYLIIDEGRQNLIVQTPNLHQIDFKDWVPITKEEYEEEKMKNNIKPLNESKGSYVPISSPLPPPAPFITGMQKVEGPTSDSYEQYRKEMDQASKDYEDHFKNPDTYGVKSTFDSFNTPYVPEKWIVEKDTIYASIQAVERGLEYAKECLEQHNLTHDIFSRKDREWKRMVEKDIKQQLNLQGVALTNTAEMLEMQTKAKEEIDKNAIWRKTTPDEYEREFINLSKEFIELKEQNKKLQEMFDMQVKLVTALEVEKIEPEKGVKNACQYAQENLKSSVELTDKVKRLELDNEELHSIIKTLTKGKLPCNPDHNGECLVCDNWLSDCPLNKK